LITRRRRALALVAVAVLVTCALGIHYAGDSHPAWSDEIALSLTRQWLPVPRGLATFVIDFYDPVPLVILIAVLAGVCLWLRRPRLAVLAVMGPVLTGVVTTIAKPVIERTKNGDLSYPSGHMGSAVAIAVVVSLLLVSVFGTRRWVVALAVLVPILWGSAVGLAMTVTYYHYWTDAIGGFCVAVAVVLSLAVLIDSRFGVGQLPGRKQAFGGPGQSMFGRGARTP
jgi:undecaprenyl-diphosphatase